MRSHNGWKLYIKKKVKNFALSIGLFRIRVSSQSERAQEYSTFPIRATLNII